MYKCIGAKIPERWGGGSISNVWAQTKEGPIGGFKYMVSN